MKKENLEKMTKEKLIKEYNKLLESYTVLEESSLKLIEQNSYLFKTASNYKDKVDYLDTYLNNRYKEFQNANKITREKINYIHYRKLLLDELDLMRDIKSVMKK